MFAAVVIGGAVGLRPQSADDGPIDVELQSVRVGVAEGAKAVRDGAGVRLWQTDKSIIMESICVIHVCLY